jgi:hypothetical protein
MALLAGEDVEAHVDAGLPGPLGERAAVVEQGLGAETWR